MAKYTTITNINGKPTEIEHEELYIVQRLEDGRNHAYKKYIDAVCAMWSDYMISLCDIDLEGITGADIVNDWFTLNKEGHIVEFGDIVVAEVVEMEDKANG